jgi:type VI secretion system protein ImpA
MLDIQSLLQPVSVGAPGGSNLEYSPEYTALERALRGKPERQIGEVVAPAEPPDWATAIEMSGALLRSTKDLRVAIELTRALLKTEAFAGFAQGLALIRGLLETFWSVFYPQLDEDGDPTARINAMAALTHRDMLHAVRSAPLAKSKAFGVVTLRDVDAANARARDGSAGPPPSWDAMFEAMPLPELTAAAGAVEASERETRELELAWKMHLETVHANGTLDGGARVDDFTELRQILQQANRFMKERLDQRQSVEAPAPNGSDGAPSAPAGVTASTGGELRTREDVVRALDRICAYYARNEPSSPVPLLLERCKRLVTMSFLDIVKDMIPDGLSNVQTIAGKRDE